MGSQTEERSSSGEAELMRGCKAIACIDRFLLHLGRIDPNLRKKYPRFNKLEVEDQGRLNEIKNQLAESLRNYAPQLFKDGELDLDAKEVEMKVYPRWEYWKVHAGKPVQFDNVFRRTVAKEQHARLLRAALAEKDKTASSLQEHAFIEACRELRQSVELDRSAASFTCGGTIAIGDQPKVETQSGEHGVPTHETISDNSCQSAGSSFVPRSSPRVRIFWTSKKDTADARKLELPMNGAQDSNQELLQQLVVECSPASFGRGNETILDPSYRNAGKLDIEHFASSFHPADFDILENVEKILLPDISTKRQNRLPFRKLTAELYKLNAYSAPSGYFRKHVDTPRSVSQIGSLVVCLPAPFEGGDLVVRHHGREVIFDWGRRSASSIQWAAFYSDCEHEIRTVTEGHRITLTYNLYVMEPLDTGILRNPSIDPQTLPLYGFIRSLTEQPGFMKDGGILGFGCSYAYPHTSKLAKELLPRTLKGSDLVLYSIFKSLGYLVNILPVLEQDGCYDITNPSLGLEEEWSCQPERADFLARSEQLEEDYVKAVNEDFQNCDNIETRSQSLFDTCIKVGEMQELRQKWRSGSRDYKCMAKVGTKLEPYFVLKANRELEELDEPDNRYFKFHWGAGITWISEPEHEEMAFTGISYGNEATTDSAYSCAVILVVIPPWQERAKMTDSA